MSSHHIVRENQEPSLLIQDFDALDRKMLDQLLEWSPTIVVDADAADFLLSEGIKIDIIFSNKTLSSLQEQTKVLPIEKHYLETALTYLIANSYSAVNIICHRLDPILQMFAPDINIVALCREKRYVFVKDHYEKWKPKGEKIYIDPQEVKTAIGLIHLEEGVFEVIDDGFFRIEFKSPYFTCVGEDI